MLDSILDIIFVICFRSHIGQLRYKNYHLLFSFFSVQNQIRPGPPMLQGNCDQPRQKGIQGYGDSIF